MARTANFDQPGSKTWEKMLKPWDRYIEEINIENSRIKKGVTGPTCSVSVWGKVGMCIISADTVTIFWQTENN